MSSQLVHAPASTVFDSLPMETFYLDAHGRAIIDWWSAADTRRDVPIQLVDPVKHRILIGPFVLRHVSGGEVEVHCQAPGGEHQVHVVHCPSGAPPTKAAIIHFLRGLCPEVGLLSLTARTPGRLRPLGVKPAKGSKGSKGGTGGRTPGDQSGDQGQNAADDAVETLVLSDIYARVKPVYGRTQLGKTGYILTMALRLSLEGISSIVVCRNANKDFRKTLGSLVRMLAEIRQFLAVHRIPGTPFDIDVLEKNITEQQCVEMITGAKPKILVTICHSTNLQKITALLPEEGEHDMRYAVYIDEADLVDSSDSQAAAELAILKRHAYTAFVVSATIMDKLLDEHVRERDMVFLMNREFYRDHASLDFRPIPLEGTRFAGHVRDDLLQTVPCLGTLLDQWSTEEPILVPAWGDDAYMPHMYLINVGDTNPPMFALQKHLISRYGEAFTSIVVAGESTGVTWWAADQPDPVSIDCLARNRTGHWVKKARPSKVQDGVHTLHKDAEVVDILAYLAQHGGVERFPRIVLIAGNMAGRCQSFVSGDCSRLGRLNWHLTDMLYVCSPTTSGPDVVQHTGRITGVFRDGVERRLWCIRPTWSKLRKTMGASDELIYRAVDTMSADQEFKDVIPTIPMDYHKVQDRGRDLTLTRHVELEVNSVPNGTDGGYGMVEGGYWDKDHVVIRPRAPRPRVEHEEDRSAKSTDARVEAFMRVAERACAQGVVGRTGKRPAIARILGWFKAHGATTVIGRHTLEDELEVKTGLAQYLRWNEAHGDYELLHARDGGYQLNPSLIRALEFVQA